MPKTWPEGGKVMIGYDNEKELKQLQQIVIQYNCAGPEPLLEVREDPNGPFEMLYAGEKLYDPQTKQRHVDNGYKDVHDGPMCESRPAFKHHRRGAREPL